MKKNLRNLKSRLSKIKLICLGFDRIESIMLA